MTDQRFMVCPFCKYEIERTFREMGQRPTRITPGEAIRMHEQMVRHIKREHGR